MPAYVISMMTIDDPEVYSKYTAKTPAIVKKHGGKFLTRGEEVVSYEDTTYDGRMVILEFPSKAHVDAWLADPDYVEAVEFRHAASTMHHLMLQEGSDNTGDPDPKL